MKSPLLAILIVLAAACRPAAGPATAASLSVVATGSALQLENLSNERLFYLVYERQAAALINWAPCVTQSCPSLAPRQQTTLEYSAIGGYVSGKTEAIVWWWRAVPGRADAPIPGPVDSSVIHL